MSIWSKIITAFKGGVNEAGEAIVDSQALRILDQEVREAGEELKASKQSLANVMAKHKVAQERVAKTKKEIKENEAYVVKALEQENESLATEVAQKISQLTVALSDQAEQEKILKENVEKFKTTIAKTERNITRLKQQVDTIKATDSLQRAQSSIAERYAGSDSKLSNALESLERIKEKQAMKAAQMEASSEIVEELGEVSLDEKLKAAGITSVGESADDILSRLRKKVK